MSSSGTRSTLNSGVEVDVVAKEKADDTCNQDGSSSMNLSSFSVLMLTSNVMKEGGKGGSSGMLHGVLMTKHGDAVTTQGANTNLHRHDRPIVARSPILLAAMLP
ncbi:hypothetical protein PIB30_061684 [Stylosanthes scabra]|uniref:Uncharacterized protein n=1 Tax=Stylosanthes scabra TaxID=79078 RepID=A0ABU6XIS2_9FABA|nr:hypothetical protein [Stylosanthes scabra]